MRTNSIITGFYKTLSLFLFIYLLIAQLPLNGVVLCIGNDGHVALEEASPSNKCKDIFRNNISDKNRESRIDNNDNKEAVTSHCGICKDLVISDPYEDHILSGYDLHSYRLLYPMPVLLPAGDTQIQKNNYITNNSFSLRHFTPVILSTKLLC